MMEAIRFSITSILTRATRRDIPADGILHSHRRENLKSYIAAVSFSFRDSCNFRNHINVLGCSGMHGNFLESVI
jgi:hypothetical protein